MEFNYCEQCKARGRDIECRYIYVLKDVFGRKYLHQSCPDQEFWGKGNNVDMTFVNCDNKDDILEIELKSIHIELEGTNNVAHDKYEKILQEDLIKVIDSCIALEIDISLKKSLNSYIYKTKIKNQLVFEIENTNFNSEEMELPKIYENDVCKIILKDIPDKFKDEHLLFAISPPPNKEGDLKSLSLWEIDTLINDVSRIGDKIAGYLTDESVKKKYKIEYSKKIILFTIEYTKILGYFANIYNEIYDNKLYEKILQDICGNIPLYDFFDNIIVAIEPIESDNAVYIIM